MKNILFIGPYRQNDGYGCASLDYLQALLTTNNNIIARPLYLNNTKQPNIPQDIQELEHKKLNKYDFVIQHCLPTNFTYIPNTKTIGLSHFETKYTKYSPWAWFINQVDKLWVCSKYEQKNLINEEVYKREKIDVVPMPTDTTVFEKDWKPVPGIKKYDDSFIFYSIGEYTRRKNIIALIMAFYREFKNYEPVELIIKTNHSVAHNLIEIINTHIGKLKDNLRLYKHPDLYKPIKIITEHLIPENLYSLHQSCHCFVMPSSGEAANRPSLDAIGFGNLVIGNKNTGMSQFLYPGLSVKSYEAPLILDDQIERSVYNGHNTWYDIDILDLQHKMRYAYNIYHDKEKLQHQKDWTKEKIKNHSYHNIGKVIEGLLNGYID